MGQGVAGHVIDVRGEPLPTPPSKAIDRCVCAADSPGARKVLVGVRRREKPKMRRFGRRPLMEESERAPDPAFRSVRSPEAPKMTTLSRLVLNEDTNLSTALEQIGLPSLHHRPHPLRLCLHRMSPNPLPHRRIAAAKEASLLGPEALVRYQGMTGSGTPCSTPSVTVHRPASDPARRGRSPRVRGSQPTRGR